MSTDPTLRIDSLEKLTALRDAARAQKAKPGDELREKILICAGGGCIASGSLKVKDALLRELRQSNLDREVAVVETGCLGPCVQGPVLVMSKGGVYYQKVTEADAAPIVQRHILNGEILEHLVWKEGSEQRPAPMLKDISFFKRQVKIVLRNCGRIDPTDIHQYIGCDGYQAMAKMFATMSPEQVLDDMKKSGLRGRGGAGFPTYLKWSFARQSAGTEKFILCNADEGDPGAFMDRSILEGDPHNLIEGMIIAAYAISATQGYVYVRAEYPLAVQRLQIALETARDYGLLGRNILGSGFSLDIEIRMGSGAFVCGEETALMASIEGKRGEPRPRPPLPGAAGIVEKPNRP